MAFARDNSLSHHTEEATVSSRIALAISCAALLISAGCATNTESTHSAPTMLVTKDDALAAQLPSKIRDSGKIIVGVNLPYAPNEFKDSSGKLVGFDVDLFNAVAKVLGVTPDYRESDFEKIIPAVQAGTYDVGMSSFTDTKAREETVDFTNYFNAGIQWAQRTGKPVDPNNACGKKVAVQSTTIEDTEDLPKRNDKCLAEGKPAIEVVRFDQQSDATNALVLGRVDAMSADSPVTAYAIKQSHGAIEATGPVFATAPYGWPTAKNSPLANLLKQALENLISTGAYKMIAHKWGVENGVISKPTVNGAVS
ncbi:MAG: ABC transporter substrate-binding protein [Nocardiaceae bacterium]|nr:ABC transporter substrate-binding protein [Nocardiaceae bacterium]